MDGRDPGNIEQIFDGINRDLLSLTTGGHLADSEGDNGDVELDDEDSVGDDRYHSASQNLSSFRKGGPAMGNRGHEGRQGGSRSRSRGGEGDKPRKSKGDKDKHGKVGQLDERNLKRAAHRYGTLPKGARIGAYLESMRVSGLTPEPGSDDTDTLDSVKSGATDPGLRSSPTVAAELLGPAMARSNSSHGGFPGPSSRQPQPRRLQTYTQSARAPPPPSPRAKHSSALHELDFPPPPPTELTPAPDTASGLGRKSRDPSSDSCGDSASVRSYSDSASLRLNAVSPVTPASHQQQLVQEILKTETPPLPATSPLPPPASPQPTGDPASQLVTELFESIKLKSDDKQNSSKPPPAPVSAQKETKTPAVTDFKAGLRKVNQHPLSHEKQEANNTSQINFKSQLKKTNTSLYAQPTSLNPELKEDESEPGRVDFKSQLKKVKTKPSNNSDLISDAPEKSEDLTNAKASLRSVSKHNIEEEEEEDGDKRRSTGSISSLKKMWEDGGEAAGQARDAVEDRPGSVVKFEKRVWPPVPSTETEKPMVPVKPTVKPPPTSKPPPPKEPSCKPPPKPSQSSKPLVSNIYAAPSSVPPRPNISAAKPKLPLAKSKPASNGASEARADSTDSGLSSSNDKENIMDLSASLENILESLAKEGITKATAMSASDKVNKYVLMLRNSIAIQIYVGTIWVIFSDICLPDKNFQNNHFHSWNNILQ